MADHYDEQKEQIDFLMSVKYKAQQIIFGQVTDFKAEVLQSYQEDESASIKLLVDEIWDIYDVDDSG
jgi:hypothetical protein